MFACGGEKEEGYEQEREKMAGLGFHVCDDMGCFGDLVF